MSVEEKVSEAARRTLGIDGTRGDAQDVVHPFWPHGWGTYCLVCGLAESHGKHGEVMDAEGRAQA